MLLVLVLRFYWFFNFCSWICLACLLVHIFLQTLLKVFTFFLNKLVFNNLKCFFSRFSFTFLSVQLKIFYCQSRFFLLKYFALAQNCGWWVLKCLPIFLLSSKVFSIKWLHIKHLKTNIRFLLWPFTFISKFSFWKYLKPVLCLLRCLLK